MKHHGSVAGCADVGTLSFLHSGGLVSKAASMQPCVPWAVLQHPREDVGMAAWLSSFADTDWAASPEQGQAMAPPGGWNGAA